MLSSFRLFMHVQTGSANGDLRAWRDSYGISPAWVKVFAPIHCEEVRSENPDIRTLLRFYDLSEAEYYRTSYNTGREFVDVAYNRCGNSFRSVTALEFLNEKTTFDDLTILDACNAAALGFVSRCRELGVRPVIHNQAFANPKPVLMYRLKDSIRAALEAGGYFAPHCYGPKNLLDCATYYVECYKAQLAALRDCGLEVPTSQVLITEFGHDTVSDPNYTGDSGAWHDLGISSTTLKAEYEAYEHELARLGIAGACMYNVYGYPDDPYEIFPWLKTWYGERLNACRGIVPSLPPIGVVPPPTTLPAWIQAWPGAGYTEANLRQAASPSGAIVGTAMRGTPLKVLGQSSDGKYYKVQLEAYIAKSVTRIPTNGDASD